MSKSTEIRPISGQGLALVCSVGCFVGALVKVIFDEAGGGTPAPFGVALVIVFLDLLVGSMAKAARNRIVKNHENVPEKLAVRWLGFARAALVGGAFLGGFHLVWVLDSVGAANTPLGLKRLIWAAVATVAAGLLMGVGKVLENSLRITCAENDEDTTYNS
ncbi:MAG: DUF3180 domain-containing protein [Propionibacteriaceae bacterium]